MQGTTPEEIELLNELRAAMKDFTVAQQMRVQRFLTSSRIIDFNTAMRLAASFTELRALCAKIDHWERKRARKCPS